MYRFFARLGNVTPIPPFVESAGGWADFGFTTTGGSGGTLKTYTNWETLWQAIRDSRTINPTEAEVYRYTGADVAIDKKRYETDNLENKTIECSNGQIISQGEIRFNSCKNIIIRNFERRGPYEERISESVNRDYFTINGCEHVWIDHCTFDGEEIFAKFSNEYVDGAIDIGPVGEVSSNYITISNCWFTGVERACLIGYSDAHTFDIGNNKVTLRNNVFRNISSRAPRVRYGQVHLLENYYDWNPVWAGTTSLRPNIPRFIQLGNGAKIYAQGEWYDNGDRLFDDFDTAGTKLSGIITDNCHIQGPFSSSYNTPLRSGNVDWNPNTLEGYNYVAALRTPAQARDYALANAGANLIIEPIV
jgi:pectate lyase